MGLLDALGDGSAGVGLRLPPGVEVLEDGPTAARWFDPSLGLIGLASTSPFTVAIHEGGSPTLRERLEADARRNFAREHVRLAQEGALAPKIGMRTEDPSWSPIVELRRLCVPGGRVLRCVYRLSYQPGHEGIWASLFCPVAEGTVTITGLCLVQPTGLRESILMAGLRQKQTGESGEIELPGQAYLDAPEHDPSFPNHGLTLLRRALDTWVDAEAGALEITRPAVRVVEGSRVALPASGCSIVPPPGFRLLRPELLQSSATLSTFALAGLDPLAPTLVDVWSLPPDPEVRSASSLARMAEDICARWADEGATKVQTTTWAVEVDTDPRAVRSLTRFEVQGEPKLALGHWLLCEDGALFRISLSIEPPSTPEVWAVAFDAVVASWQRNSPSI